MRNKKILYKFDGDVAELKSDEKFFLLNLDSEQIECRGFHLIFIFRQET